MSNPRSFSIHGKGLKLNTRADIEPHLKKLREMKDVEEVHFGGNTLGVEASEALAEVLSGLKSLKIADFADVFTGRLITEIPQALAAICNSLKDLTSLIELDLSDNAFGGRSSDPIVPFLTQNRTFQILKLNNNGLGPSGGGIIANALLESARLSKAEGKASNLRTIICGRNRLQDESALLFAKAFAAHGNFVDVRMPQNGIRMDGIAALARGLAANSRLESLDLQDNCAKGAGTRALAKALASWPELKTLNLSECLLGGRAGIALALALRNGSNPKLETLKLQLGELDHRSLSILAKAIHDHGSEITLLELNANRADPEDQCIQDIKAALAVHGHEDALDELDEMEEFEEDEENEEEAKEAEEEEEQEEKKEPVVKDDKEAEELAELMANTSLEVKA
ncbi:Ran GTPase activator [Fomitiporia mediterranea MF3/22]|uniref:Ran GTPase activator n=1 Tax=Fomitiporia mediterranea (strain MF3/22) TaxID=694068 RepID=UPI0004409BAA|nr:Ran GTPase activator [Fomitiporia mediterranea MF3/22]EJD03658.1 Ran GTPase activator [Fomitiporia mediterranea MF3/22]